MGASATRSRRTGGTDSTSFNEAGLPGIGLSQDPIEYGSLHLAHQPRHLRAHRRGRREEVGDRDCGRGLSPGDARRDAAAVQQGADAGAAAGGSQSRLQSSSRVADLGSRTATPTTRCDHRDERFAEILGLAGAHAADAEQRRDRRRLDPRHLAQRRVVEDHVGRHAARPRDVQPQRAQPLEQIAVDVLPRLGFDLRAPRGFAAAPGAAAAPARDPAQPQDP